MESNNSLDVLAKILAFNEIRDYEEYELRKAELEIISQSKIS